MGGACCLHDRGVQKLTLNMLCPFLTSPGEGRPQHNITCPWAINFVDKQNEGQFCAPGYNINLIRLTHEYIELKWIHV